MQVGDVVVVVMDEADNGITDFEVFIGIAGEVVEVFDDGGVEDCATVSFDGEGLFCGGTCWSYEIEKLEVIGHVRQDFGPADSCEV